LGQKDRENGRQKNWLEIFGLLLLWITFVIGCNNGNDPGSSPQSVVYTSKDVLGNTYKLTITENTSKAVYTIKVGDTYELIIVSPSGTTKTSKGSVKSSVGGSLMLLPSNGDVTFSITITDEKMATISGTITLIDGEPESVPTGDLTPVDNNNNENGTKAPFEGSWKGWNGDGSAEKIWQFAGNNFVAIIGGVNNAKGTFTYTATTITLTCTHTWNGSSWEPWSQTFSANYIISGNNLTLEGDGNGQPFVKTKQQ
jgi:hypothetical protein